MVKYVQSKDFGTVCRTNGKKYEMFNPWKGKWETISESDGMKEFYDDDDNRACTGKNVNEVIKAQSDYCAKSKGKDCDLKQLASIILK